MILKLRNNSGDGDMRKKINTILIFVSLILLCCIFLSADSEGATPVDFFNIPVDETKYTLLAKTENVYNPEYWHYSGGYWMDSDSPATRIYDDQEDFWDKPQLYADRPDIQINATVPLPQPVKDHIASGKKMLVALNPKLLDIFNVALYPTFHMDAENLYLSALPKFHVDNKNSYDTFIPALQKFIPIVKEGYGWNLYAIYQGSTELGKLESSFAPDPERIEFTDILDIAGRLKPGKVFQVQNTQTGVVTTVRSEDATIGDGTFNGAGAVGMQFTFPFELSFYKDVPADLRIKAHTPAHVVVGERVVSKIVIENHSDKDLSHESIQLEMVLNGVRRTAEFSIGKNAQTVVEIEWNAPSASCLVLIDAVVNPGNTVEESDYSNNAAHYVVQVEPGTVETDFLVTGFREDEQRIMEIARSYVKVKNTGSIRHENVEISFFDGTNLRTKIVAFEANQEKEVDFEWHTPQEPGVVHVWAQINPERNIAESDYDNNKKEFSVTILDLPVDLTVLSVTPSKYPAGKQVITLIEVQNNSGKDFSGTNPVEVRLSIPSIGYEKTVKVFLDKNCEQYVPFIWNAPSYALDFIVIATVNPNSNIIETNYGNNVKQLNAETIENANPDFGCNITRREWSELRYSHSQRINVMVGEVVYTFDIPVYNTVNFYAEVSISAVLIPGTMKSGYGVECEVTVDVQTNYDNPEYVTNLQSVYAYLPTDRYRTAISLETIPGTTNKWRFSVNPASLSDNRVQYVPVEWPDKSVFSIGFTGRDAQSPGGAMCASVYADVYIDGNMYEDDRTAPVSS